MDRESLGAAAIARALADAGVEAQVEYYERIASTNDRARARVTLGQWDGVASFCVAADYQAAGRGRRANAWHSPPGVSLLFTIVDPAATWEKAGALAGLAIALAVAEALDDLYGLRAKIKWPNDVRVVGRKLSGILVERATAPADDARVGSSAAALIFGVGVNVNQSRSDFPADLQETATSVARECGHSVDRLELLTRIVTLGRRYRGEFAAGRGRAVLEAIRRRLDSIGRIVTIEREGDRQIEGTAIGVESDGGLVVRMTNGHVVKCLSGSLIEH